jgi:hypothetical protein
MTHSGPTPAGTEPAEHIADHQAADHQAPDATDAEGVTDVNDTADAKDEERGPTLLEQMGGVSGLVYSSVPVLVFVGVYLPVHSLVAAIWSAVGAGVAILAWRLVRREPVQPAISGLFGVGVAAFIAYRTGSARGYFLFGIWTSLIYGGAFLLSVLVRWPLAGVVWSALNSTGMGWRADRSARRYYVVATIVWAIVFGGRFVVQQWLYVQNLVGWLGITRIAMGWPLTALAALVTVWAVRRADARQKALQAQREAEPSAGSVSTT